MAAIVMSDNRTRANVPQKMRTSRIGDKPSMKPEMMAVISSPVPVAESQLNAKVAGSAVAFATTGGARETALSNSGIEKVTAVRLSINVLIVLVPKAKTINDNTTQGIHASMICSRVGAATELITAIPLRSGDVVADAALESAGSSRGDGGSSDRSSVIS